MLTLEFEPPNTHTCTCCGQEAVRLTRFVYKDGGAFAVYYFTFTRGHERKEGSGIISLGEWGEGGDPSQRLAFPFRIWTNESHYQVGLMDAEECLWREVTLLGRILDRQEALQHPWVKDVFHITDHIVTEDKEVVDFFVAR